jgi:hypothetical protein
VVDAVRAATCSPALTCSFTCKLADCCCSAECVKPQAMWVAMVAMLATSALAPALEEVAGRSLEAIGGIPVLILHRSSPSGWHPPDSSSRKEGSQACLLSVWEQVILAAPSL